VPPNVNLGPPNISLSTRDRKLQLKTIRYCEVLALHTKISALGGQGCVAPSVNLGPP